MHNHFGVLTSDMSQPEDYIPNVIIHDFRNGFSGDFLSTKTECQTDFSVYDFISKVSEAVRKLEGFSRIESIIPGSFIVHGGENVMLHVYTHHDFYSIGNSLWVTGRKKLIIRSFGNPESLRKLETDFLKAMELPDTPSVYWTYMSDGRKHEKRVRLNPPRTLYPEFYPWLKESPDSYIDRFISGDSGLIILRGEPGTGKTSFIHHILWRSGLHATMTYDEVLFKSDEMFVEFLTEDESGLLIMEDADAMLTSREREGNPLMNKFLNISDGLIRFPDKKIIISANIIENHRIDSALMRPGRCFDTPVFRKLTHEEACAAADAAGIERPEGKKDITLAELFNRKNGGGNNGVIGIKTGFSVGN